VGDGPHLPPLLLSLWRTGEGEGGGWDEGQQALTPRPPLPFAFAYASAMGEGEPCLGYTPSLLLPPERASGRREGAGGGMRAILPPQKWR